MSEKKGSEPVGVLFTEFLKQWGNATRESFLKAVRGPLLIFRSGSGQSHVLDLDEIKKSRHPTQLMIPGLTIGREANCDLPFDESSISKKHAGLAFDGYEWKLIDLDSTNGTFSADNKLDPWKPCVLKDQHKYSLARCVEIQFWRAENFFKELKKRKTVRIERATREQLEQSTRKRRSTSVTDSARFESLLRRPHVNVPRDVRQFSPITKTLSFKRFRDRYPLPFLLYYSYPLRGTTVLDDETRLIEEVFEKDDRLTLKYWILASSTGAPNISLGRHSENDIQIEHPSVSKHHAMISLRNGFYYLMDMNSKCGSFHYGKRITTEIQLADEAEFSLGSAGTLRLMESESFQKFVKSFSESGLLP